MIRLFIPLVILVSTLSYSQNEAITANGDTVVLYENGKWELKHPDYTNLELPSSSDSQVIRHQAYSLLYSEEHEQAIWVAYKLKEDQLIKKADRKDNFRPDPSIPTGSADLSDYKGSGYDRGHLAPAGDMVRSEEVMSESFYFSNMSPQVGSFNRGPWRLLEEKVRDWTKQFDSLYITTGPVFDTIIQKIGANEVSVPGHYYKVLLAKTAEGFVGIGFVMENSASSGKFEQHAVSIDSVESLTGIDFYPALSDSIESIVESTLCKNCWGINTKFNPGSSFQKGPPPPPNGTTQCKGITQSGDRCKRNVYNNSGYCYQHKTK
jgi:endonuclease G